MDNTDNSNAHHNAHYSDLPVLRPSPTKWVGAPIRAIAGLTLDQLWVVVAMALVLFRPLIVPISPHDFWWHMATGRLITQTGTIPMVDSFSYTQAGEPFYNQGWLAQLLLYGLHSLGSIPLILVVQAAVIGVSYWLVLSLCIKRSNGAIQASVILLLLGVMPISFDNWLVRPQSYAFPLFMGFLTILTLWRWGINRWLWLLPLLMIIWVNVHGSFVLGGALIALTFVGVLLDTLFSPFLRSAAATAPPAPPLHDTVSLRWLFVWGVITAAAMFLNPRGVGVLGYVFDLLNTSSVTNLVTEWAAPTIRTGDGIRFFLFLIITTLILTYSRRAPNIADMVIVLPFLWLALGAGRNIVWFAMVFAPIVAVHFGSNGMAGREASENEQDTSHRPSSPPPQPIINALVVGMLGLLLVVGLPWVKPMLGLPPEVGSLITPATPVQAVEALQEEPSSERPAHLYHAMRFGSYMMWAAPEQPVFIDTRIELYPFEQWIDYRTLNSGEKIDELIAKYEIDGFLLHKEEQASLLQALQERSEWEVRYEDEWSSYLTPRQE